MFQVTKPIVDADLKRLEEGVHTAEIKFVNLKEDGDKVKIGVVMAAIGQKGRMYDTVWKNFYLAGYEKSNPVLAKSSLKALFRTCGQDQKIIDQLYSGELVDLSVIVGTIVTIDVEHNGDFTNAKSITRAEAGDQLTPEHSGDDSIGQKQRKLAVAGR